MRKITYFLNEGDRNRLLNEDSTIFFEFKEVIDIYCVTDKARGLKEHAIYGNASGGSYFLLKIQNLGDDGKAWTSNCYKKEISAVFKADLGDYSAEVHRIHIEPELVESTPEKKERQELLKSLRKKKRDVQSYSL